MVFYQAPPELLNETIKLSCKLQSFSITPFDHASMNLTFNKAIWSAQNFFNELN